MTRREFSLVGFGVTLGLTAGQFLNAINSPSGTTWLFFVLTAAIPVVIWNRHLSARA